MNNTNVKNKIIDDFYDDEKPKHLLKGRKKSGNNNERVFQDYDDDLLEVLERSKKEM